MQGNMTTAAELMGRTLRAAKEITAARSVPADPSMHQPPVRVCSPAWYQQLGVVGPKEQARMLVEAIEYYKEHHPDDPAGALEAKL